MIACQRAPIAGCERHLSRVERERLGDVYRCAMAISPYIERIRRRIGTDLLLVPTVAVLPRDISGRVLLVRQIDSGKWATIGGTIEPDESPEDAARREAREEAGIDVRLGRLVAALGGPAYRITYPNGDQTACVPLVYEATIEAGDPAPDGDETSDTGWFHPDELAHLDLNNLNRALLARTLPGGT
jgi:8-oxo-dGTP pyrophosphatase MutT (NUDIX family)